MRILTALSSSSSHPRESVQFHQALARDLSGEIMGMALITRLQLRSSTSWFHNGVMRSLQQISPLRSGISAKQFYADQGLPVLSFSSLNDASLARWLRKSKVTVVLCLDLWEEPKIDILSSVDLIARVTLSQDGLRSYVPRFPFSNRTQWNRICSSGHFRDTLRIRALTPVPDEMVPLLELELPTARGAGYGLAGAMTAAHLNGINRAGQSARGEEQSGLTDNRFREQRVINRSE